MSEPDAHSGRPDAHAGADAPPGTPDAEDSPDAPSGTPDATTTPPDAMTAPTATLLLSEVALAPTPGELIEVYNPTAAPVTLTYYFLTDVPSYFRLPNGGQTIDSNDFIARFPTGATIAAGETIVVALDTTANFTTQYGIAPDYSIADPGTPMTVSSTGAATLTNTGEPVVLFYWDGTSDLVSDVDIVIAGDPSGANPLQDKSGVAIDGPDADSSTTAYATDARTMPTTAAPASGKSIKRIMLETGHETQTGGGNGLSGDDETSEQIGTTWDSTYTAPTPGSTTL